MVKQVEVKLKPLTVSKAWQGRRFKTNAYKSWQRDFCLLVGKQTPITGNLSLTLELYLKNDKMSDIDNTLKVIQDSMTLSGMIEDDRFIYEIHAYKYHSELEFIRITLNTI
jgi:Holliday junction resolvase RusA-like endonuclease